MAVGATVQAHAGPLPGFRLAGQTDRILLYSRSSRGVKLARLERSLSRVERILGQRFAGRLAYYHYECPEEIAFATGRYADGVTFGDLAEVHAVDKVTDHELVHALAWQLGNPGSFFHEGLAVALGDRGKWWGRDVNKAARKAAGKAGLSALIARFNPAEPGDGYYVAGSFVSWLVERYGVERVGEFFRSCDGGDTAAVFARVFGQTFDEAGDSWRATL
jgi:hypothetical protein